MPEKVSRKQICDQICFIVNQLVTLSVQQAEMVVFQTFSVELEQQLSTKKRRLKTQMRIYLDVLRGY